MDESGIGSQRGGRSTDARERALACNAAFSKEALTTWGPFLFHSSPGSRERLRTVRQCRQTTPTSRLRTASGLRLGARDAKLAWRERTALLVGRRTSPREKNFTGSAPGTAARPSALDKAAKRFGCAQNR